MVERSIHCSATSARGDDIPVSKCQSSARNQDRPRLASKMTGPSAVSSTSHPISGEPGSSSAARRASVRAACQSAKTRPANRAPFHGTEAKRSVGLIRRIPSMSTPLSGDTGAIRMFPMRDSDLRPAGRILRAPLSNVGAPPQCRRFISNWRRKRCSPSKIPSGRKCYLCLRNNLLPMCPVRTREVFGGPEGIRTLDLFHAMEARSQLRHRPTEQPV